ncbi:unnamed protein product [Closterium sp. NIES-54]
MRRPALSSARPLDGRPYPALQQPPSRTALPCSSCRSGPTPPCSSCSRGPAPPCSSCRRGPAPPYSSRRRGLPRPAAAAVAALPRPAAAAVAALPCPVAAAVAVCPDLQQLPSRPCPRPAPAAVAALPRPAAAAAEITAAVVAPPCRCSDPAVAAVMRLPFPPLVSTTIAPAATAAPVATAAPAASGMARCSSRSVLVSSTRPSSFVSGTLVGVVGVAVVGVALAWAVRELLVVASRGSLSPARCPYIIRTGVRTSQPCGTVGHTGSRCFARLSDAWSTEFGDNAELPDWVELLRKSVDIFALDYDAILTAMYALSTSAEGAYPVCLPPDPGIQSATLGAGEAAALRACTSPAPGASAAAPLGASASAAPGLHLPSFSTNLVSGADLQDAWVAASSQVFAAASRSSPASAPCSCRPLAHETLLWHHRLGHPSLPRLRGMASRALVSGLPRSLPPLPPGPAPTCLPCVEDQQCAAPHSSSFPLTEAPLQTLHMDVWGPARVRGQGHERYFLLVIDDYSRYTTVFPLRSKGEVPEVLIDWIRNACRQLSESFGSDLPVLRLHSDRGGEFSSDLLRAFCRSEGIRQTFTLPASPQQNGIAERRIGMVMDVARTSMIHAAAPHFLWPFAVQYAAHQINLQPRVSLTETTPTLRWTGKVGDASAFRVCGYRAFVRDTTADKLSSRAVPCVFLGFPPDAPGWQFYHPTSRRVLSSQDVTFDESVSYYHPLPPQGLAPSGVSQVDPAEPVEVADDSGAARGADPAGAGTGGAETWGAESGGVETGGAESGGTETRRAEPGGVAPEGTVSGGAEPARAESGGALGVPSRREPLSPQRLPAGGAAGAGATGGAGGATGATGGAGAAGGAAGAGTARGAAGAGAAGGATGAGAARDAGGASGATGGAGAAGGGAGAGATGGAAGTRDPGAEGTGSVFAVSGATARPRLYYVPLLQQPASLLPGPSPYSGLTKGLTERREPESRPVSPVSHSASPVRTVRTSRVSRPRPPPVPGTHSMTLRPSTAPQHVPLPSPPASSLPDGPELESDSLRAASPTVTRFLATAVTDPLFESTAASALITELVDFAASCRLDYAASLVAESTSVCPPSVGDPDAPDIPTPCSYAEAIEGPYSSQWQAAMDAEMASWKSTGTYVDEVPPPGANIVSGMWIFRVKRPSGSPPAFKARYVARGFSQRQGVDFFHTFSPTPKMTTLRVLLHVAAQRDYELHSLDFSTAFLQGSLHEEIWLRRPPGFTGSFPPGDLVFATADTEALAHVKSELQKRHTCTDLGELTSYLGLRITRDRAQRTITLTQSHMVQQVLQCFGFTYSSPQSTPLPTGDSLSAPPSDESVEPSGPYPELVGCLMYLMTCTRPDLAYPLSLLARYVAPGRHRKVHWDAAKRVLCYLCSTSGMGIVLGGRARVVLTGHANASWAEIYAGAMAAQELRWLTYLLTDLGEAPCSPPVLYVDNKAMLAVGATLRFAFGLLSVCVHVCVHGMV